MRNLVAIALAVTLWHQPLLRGRLPVEMLQTCGATKNQPCTWDNSNEAKNYADCYAALDALPKTMQTFAWCRPGKVDDTTVGAGTRYNVDKTKPIPLLPGQEAPAP